MAVRRRYGSTAYRPAFWVSLNLTLGRLTSERGNHQQNDERDGHRRSCGTGVWNHWNHRGTAVSLKVVSENKDWNLEPLDPRFSAVWVTRNQNRSVPSLSLIMTRNR